VLQVGPFGLAVQQFSDHANQGISLEEVEASYVTHQELIDWIVSAFCDLQLS
jgi:hypothetical protein